MRQLVVDSEQAGRRMDNFLMTLMGNVPKSRVYQMVRKGEVRVNGRRVRADYRLEPNDRVRVPPVRLESPRDIRPPGDKAKDLLAGRILYRDDALMVINKPSGMAVHGGSGVNLGVIETLRALFPDLRSLELVHRLDRDTSGCLMVATKASALRRLHALLRQGEIGKTYLTLVAGNWKGGVVRQALVKNVMHGGERIVRVSAAGKAAVSTFSPVRQFAAACLMEVELGTGRTHQIRVHAAHEGHPVAGDEKYGDVNCNRKMREFGLRRLFLHAARLAIPASEGRDAVTVMAPLPPELQRVLDGLR